MKGYETISRRYRPQKFADVVGQDATLIALTNAIIAERVGHAYLFSGVRGTGKTTLARLLAKAINCQKRPTGSAEPCQQCDSCLQISRGASLDVLEIDGASHRGIDDVRALNESAPYGSSSGRFKVYIIDEVHMLTKEAFNALLKTLEEPPPDVKFFFATTEPERLPATILSRCQRFQLHRIPSKTIRETLQAIVEDLGVNASSEALILIAQMAEGSLRDAQSLLDQVLCFHGNMVTVESVSATAGLLPWESLFALDRATETMDVLHAFRLTAQLFSGGKDSNRFFLDLLNHYRTLLLLLIDPQRPLDISKEFLEHYQQSAKLYTKEQLLSILDDLVETSELIKNSNARQFALEMLLTRIIRSRRRVPLEVLVKRVLEIESTATQPVAAPPKPPVSEEPKKGIIDYNTAIRFAQVELEGSVE